MKTIYIYLLTGVIIILNFSGCIYDEVTRHHQAITDTIIESSSVDYRHVPINLPYAKGVELVERNCRICHSLKYIEMQPPMSAASWSRIVKKMQTVYGMPVNDSNAINQIVDYLVTIKGVKK